MASTNFTTHYSIPLPLGTDLTTPMDYNEAAEEIDTALFGAVTDAGNASEAAGEAVNTANTASAAVDAIGADLALEKAKIVQLQTRMTAAENDIDDVYTDVTDMITAYKEPSATSTHAYAIGDYFIYNNTLYQVTAAIAIGDTIVPNTNCQTTNVVSEIGEVNANIATEISNVNVKLDGKANLFRIECVGTTDNYGVLDLSQIASWSSVFDPTKHVPIQALVTNVANAYCVIGMQNDTTPWVKVINYQNTDVSNQTVFVGITLYRISSNEDPN